ncbi:MAG: acyl dehydratase [Deltaproteobacteria bacterium]|uniref:MaoC/PaaZ C-terminal domain-containing protein n=1 Tax=Desulfobacula sp. TaxID=2593537 RepID=UPI0019932271|nr:acyl dehydratase [Candidatus Desulfobacula maris]MBL6996687.1 acyl dehydratase [Desulfobacula sp.]
MKYFEDFVVGDSEWVGEYHLTEEEIISYGEKWDPQFFHVDTGAAENSVFFGLVAPGKQLIGITVLKLVTHQPKVSILAALGWDEVRFHEPARPNDILTVFRECLEARPSNSKLDRGIVKNRVTLYNSKNRLLLSYVDSILVLKRPLT